MHQAVLAAAALAVTAGNGGAGGNGGVVAIKGGTVTAEGKNGAAGIGGGAGGNGGNGGSGGSGGAKVGNQNATVANHFGWGDVYWYPGFGGAGGNGEGGYGGTGGTGGAGGTLTITGGKVQSNGYTGFGGGSVGTAGTKGNGTRTNGESSTHAYFWYAKGGSNSWTNQYCGHWYGNNAEAYYSQAAGPGGNGGAAGAQAAANANGTDGTLTITGSSNNVDFVSNGGGSLTNGRPTDKNKDPLYRVELTVYDLQRDSKIENAKVNVDVPGGEGKAPYTYKTVSETDGKAVVWLPAGTYKLEKKAVNHDTLGAIPKDQPVTLTVKANDDNKQDVLIGVFVNVTVDKKEKVYFAKDSESPLNIRVDTSEVEQTISSVKWFRETIKDHEDTEYAPTGTGNKEAFDDKYAKITENSGNKGTLTNVVDKVYSLPINQNGRYWVQIEYTSNGVAVKVVKGLTVDNIYRTFKIQTRDVELDRDGQTLNTGDYGPLRNANGTNNESIYGFPWDLNGYNSTDITKGTLLQKNDNAYDTVQINGLNNKAPWHKAAFGRQQTEIPKTDKGDAYEPITLTLNQAFLNGNDADLDGTNPNVTKYTITYQAEGVPVAQFPIRGVVLNANGSEKEELYQYPGIYPDSIKEDTIYGLYQKGYRIEKVLVNSTEHAVDAKGGITLKNIHGTAANNYKDAIQNRVCFCSNMTDVTIHCYKQGTNEPITADVKVSAELGKPFQYQPPTFTDYEYIDADPADGKLDSVTAGKAITFYYLKKIGNVTYRAMAADDNTVLKSKTEQVQKGDAINKTAEKANTLFAPIPYYTLESTEGDASADQYDGATDVTVTYTYKRNLYDLKIIKKDVDTGDQIGEQTIRALPAGKLHTFAADEVTPVANYTALGLNPTSYTMGDAKGEVVFWYQKNPNNRFANVTVKSICDGDIINSYVVPAVKGVQLTIPAPTLKGYTLVEPTKTTQDITPNGDTTHDTVTFEYQLDSPRTVQVKLQDSNGNDLNNKAPAGYQMAYTLKQGDSVTIVAPVINGYSIQGDSIETVTYDGAGITGKEVSFTYAPVSTAEFVTHTVKFKLGSDTNPDVGIIYQYEKLIPKSDTVKTTYDAASVNVTMPGYKLEHIGWWKVGDTAPQEKHETSLQVPNNENVTIIYHFSEDAAKIKIKQKCSDTNHTEKTIELTGYRIGQKGIVVIAPPWEGHVLSNPTQDRQTRLI